MEGKHEIIEISVHAELAKKALATSHFLTQSHHSRSSKKANISAHPKRHISFRAASEGRDGNAGRGERGGEGEGGVQTMAG